MIRGIDHIELIVRDVEEFISFFEKMGFKVIKRTSHHGSSAELQLRRLQDEHRLLCPAQR